MKKLLLFAASICLILSVSYGQYTYDPNFPNKSLSADSVLIGTGNGLHGVAVDPYGNVWTVNYNTYIKGDSIKDPVTNVTKAVLPLRIFKPDGTPVSFSPLMILKGGAVNDTLYKGNTGRGLATAADGNILFTWFSNVYLINYKTGAVITKIVASPKNSGIAVATDVSGNIFTGPVANNLEPIQMFDNTGTKVANVTDTTRYFSRTLTCSRDGGKVYYAGYTGHCIIRYTGDALSGFTADTVLKGFDCEALTRHGQTDMLWAAAGNTNADLPNKYPQVKTYYSAHTWYLWDPTTNQIKDSVKWNGLNTWNNTDSLNVKPRGVSTTKNGDTLYVCMFGAKAGMYSIQRFVKSPTSVYQENGIVASNYSLMQNYPNPFNPSTQIKFSLLNNATISLTVYDVLGKEIVTLAEGAHTAGVYTAKFDATNLSAGIYFYTLRTSDGFIETKKMLLLK